MESSILKQIARFLQEQKKQKRWLVVFLCLAIIVGFGTVTALKMRGQAMTHKEKRVICQLAVHQHADECYDENKENLICGYADYVVHVHNEDCYDWNGNLTCQLPEVEKHEHSEECYTEESTLICGLEETAGHQHGAECYTTQQGGLICQVPEHTHAAECYDETGAVICGLEEHIHEDACYEWTDVLICQLAEGADGHTHTEACYEVKEILSCGKLELHTHTDACYEKINEEEELSETNRRLVCTIPVLEEHIHTEDAGCLETVEVTANGELVEEGTVEEETTEGETEEEIFTTDLDGEEAEEEDGESEADAEEEETETADDASEEDTESSETDGEADGDEVEGAEEGNASYETVKTFVGDGYKVTASYNEDANIPEEAELIAERITVDSDEEHYAKREAEYRKSTGDKNAVMKALFKVGFYVDGKEVEPETAVKLTIQLFDENGLPEGTPITVVHFAEKGTEVLDGSEAESGSTSFEMESFSDVAIGFKKADAKKASVTVSDSFQYKDEAFQITFHIEGKAKFEETVDEGNTEDGVVGEEDDAEEEESNADVSEDSKAEVEEEVNADADVSDGEVSVEQESESEQMITLPSVESADTDGTNSATGDETSDEAGENAGTGILEFKVVPLEKGTPEYDAAVAHANSLNDGSELLLVKALSYGMYYSGRKLNLNDCQVTAEIEPTKILSEKVKDSVPDAISYLREEGEISDEPSDTVADDMQTEFTIRALQMVDETEAEETDSIYLNEENPSRKMVVTLQEETAIVYATGTPNPEFTVQYYANLNMVAYNDDNLVERTVGDNTNVLSVIDTTGGENNLPQNGSGVDKSPNGNTIRSLYVDKNSGKLKTKGELREVYESRSFEYHKAPTINYINAVIENPSYELKEVWVLKTEKDAESTVKNDWDIYEYSTDLHFTNRKTSATENYVYIEDKAVIRLVYDPKETDKDIDAAFYDYDIGDGFIYQTAEDAGSQKNQKQTSTQLNGTWYMHTAQSGINSPNNYKGSGTKLAFGNSNSGSGLQYQKWNGNLLNKFNGTQDNNPPVVGSYKGCTFGLTTGLKDGKVQYANDVIAPNLFGDGDAAGKTAYSNYSLKFDQVGDTHTLKAVNNTAANDLDRFNNPNSHKWDGTATTHYHIWTNNFWPMDSVGSYGTNGHDMKFGNYDNKAKRQFVGENGDKTGKYTGAPANGAFPWSDDDIDHNSYFGMQYRVDFELVADYVGPLEYYFFGDDDMWVFLSSDDNKTGKLVCDIGGVHSSVGEYLNLWDYIDKEKEGIHRHGDECYTNGEDNPPTCGKVDKKKFTLNFFYTERGESGSTCWMQFTLPSVSSKTPETTDKDFGHLKISKEVVVTVNGTDYPAQDLFGEKNENGEFVKEQGQFFNDKEFTFKLTIPGLKDDYAYVKYDRNGKPVGDSNGDSGGGILTWETIADGEEFTLKDGEYIRIQYLPKGTTYTITEIGDTEIQGVVYTTTDITADDKGKDSNGELLPDGDRIVKKYDSKETSGIIPVNDISEIDYINKYVVYELPKTGGPGIIVYTIAGVLVIMLGAGFMYRKKVRERRV